MCSTPTSKQQALGWWKRQRIIKEEGSTVATLLRHDPTFHPTFPAAQQAKITHTHPQGMGDPFAQASSSRNMETSRALSEASVLTSVADDGDHSLAYYGSKYGKGDARRTSPGSRNTSPMSKNDSIGHSATADSPDETGWRDLIHEVRRSWEEAKLLPHPVAPTLHTVPQGHPAHPASAAAAPRSLRESRAQPKNVSPPRSPPTHSVAVPHRREVPHRGPTVVHAAPPQHRERRMGASAAAQLLPPTAGTNLSSEAYSRPVSPELSVASLDRWDATTPGRVREARTVVQHHAVVQHHHQRRAASASGVVRRSQSAAAQPPVADSAGLKRRVQALQRTVSVLQDDKAHLESVKHNLVCENEQYRRAVASKDTRLHKLRIVKQKIGTLATLDRRGAELNVKRQQAINSLDSDIKALFTGMAAANLTCGLGWRNSGGGGGWGGGRPCALLCRVILARYLILLDLPPTTPLQIGRRPGSTRGTRAPFRSTASLELRGPCDNMETAAMCFSACHITLDPGHHLHVE